MPDFPNTGYLSTFEPPAENPLYENGAWGPLFPGVPQLRKRSDHTVTYSTEGDAVNYSVWLRDMYHGNAEVWACTLGGQLGAALETWRIALWTGIGTNAGVSGYLLYYGGALSKNFQLRTYHGGNVNNWEGVSGGSAGGGYPERMGLRINGDNVEGWAMYSGVWQLMFSAAHSEHRGAFYLGIGIEDPTSGASPSLAIGCFGGGAPHRSQDFRWHPNLQPIGAT